MPQVVSQELLEYLRCCDSTGVLPPVHTLKYVYSRNGLDTSITQNIIDRYVLIYTDVSTINTNHAVGAPGIDVVEITYVNGNTSYQEVINIDTTSSSTFWTDINNWLLANDFNSISYDAGLDKYLINDVLGETYIHIEY